MSAEWKTDAEKTTQYVWYLENDFSNVLEAMVKWDGCVHIWHKYPFDADPDQDQDYMHIDDLEGFIEALIGLRDRTNGFREH